MRLSTTTFLHGLPRGLRLARPPRLPEHRRDQRPRRQRRRAHGRRQQLLREDRPPRLPRAVVGSRRRRAGRRRGPDDPRRGGRDLDRAGARPARRDGARHARRLGPRRRRARRRPPVDVARPVRHAARRPQGRRADGHAPRHHRIRRGRRRDASPHSRRASAWSRPSSRASSRSAARWQERGRNTVARRVIDLSQPLSRESQLHPFFSPTQILRHIVHSDAPAGRPSFNAEIIITSNHAATHVDAIGHYLPGRRHDRRDAARHVLRRRDLRRHPRVPARPRRHAWPRPRRPLAASGQELREGDILLFCSDHYNRTAGTPAFLDGFCGISAECRALDGRPRREDLRRRDDLARPRLPDRRATRRTGPAASAG